MYIDFYMAPFGDNKKVFIYYYLQVFGCTLTALASGRTLGLFELLFL